MIYAASIFAKQPNIGTVFWATVGSETCPISNHAARCLIHQHNTKTIADLIQTSAWLRNPPRENMHQPSIYCRCHDCNEDWLKQCWTLHECAKEALTRINMIFPKLNPLHWTDYHGNLSLTPAQKNQNCIAKENNEVILFDPSITSKNTLADCFRIFTDAERISRNPARHQILDSSNRRHNPIVVYTDGACYNNGKQNAQCGGGIWFGPNDPRNCAIHIPGVIAQVSPLASLCVLSRVVAEVSP